MLEYRVEISENGLTDWSVIDSGISGLTDVLSSQPVGYAKYYRVWRVWDTHDIIVSDPVRVIVMSSPTLTATGGEEDHIELEWNDVGASYYRVYRHDPQDLYAVADNYWDLLAITDELYFWDYNLSLDTHYIYYIAAVTFNDETAFKDSNQVTSFITEGGIMSTPTTRATVYQGVQIARETTPGILKAARFRVPLITLTPTPQTPTKVSMSQAGMGGVGVQHSKKWMEGKWTSDMEFNFLAAIFSSMYGYTAPNVDVSGAAATWNWNPSSIGPITVDPAAFSVEQGSSKGAEKWPFNVFPDLTLTTDKNTASMEGNFFGNYWTRNATMTQDVKVVTTDDASATDTSLAVTALTGAIPSGTVLRFSDTLYAVTSANAAMSATTITVIALADDIPSGSISHSVDEMQREMINPLAIGCWLSTTDGSSGSFTQFATGINSKFDFGGMWKYQMNQNDTSDTFTKIVQVDPKITATVNLEEGTEADSLFADVEDGSPVYLGIKAIGGEIVSGGSPINHLLKANIPMYVTKPDPKDTDGTYSNEYTFELRHDRDFGLGNIQLINTLVKGL